MDYLQKILSHFPLEGEVKRIDPINSGLINNTFLVETSNKGYILQRKNKYVFPNIPALMSNIVKVTDHIRRKIIQAGGDPEKEVMNIIPSKNGELYFMDEKGEYWTMSLFIPGTTSYESATSPALAKKGGEAIGKFQYQLSDFEGSLYPTIEGFHDLSYRFRQWDETLRTGLNRRIHEVSKEIVWIEKRRPVFEEFWSLVEKGELPKRVTHNDTKLSNILFDQEGNVLCVIDLDTVMSNTPLADYGDAIRSFANTGAEDDRNLNNVKLDLEKYRAYTEGYLSQVGDILNDKELEYLSFAPQYITYEQVMRFLMDYINGDIYYKTDYEGHNLVRTRSQMKLMEEMEKAL